MKTIIGTFTVKDWNNQTHNVIITQEIFMGKKKTIKGAVKHLALDVEDGEEVFPTDDPSIFQLDNGSQLKKIGTIKFGSSS